MIGFPEKKEHAEDYLVFFMMFNIFLILIFDFQVEKHTVDVICKNWDARAFMDNIGRIPLFSAQRHMAALVGYGLLVMLTVFRTDIAGLYLPVRYLLSAVYLIACVAMMLAVNDVQSVLVLSFTVSLLSYYKDWNRIPWLIIMVSSFIFLSTDFFESIFIKFSMSDFIEYYDAETEKLLFGLHSVLCSTCIVLIVGYLMLSLRIRIKENITISRVNELLQNTTEELKQSNQALKEYSEKVEEMTKIQERNRIAREIHDTLGHTLIGIASSIEVCQKLSSDTDETVKKYLNASRQMALSGLDNVRRSLNALRPDLLEHPDIDVVLSMLVSRFRDIQDVHITYEHLGNPFTVSDDEKDTIFRIVQESMTNSVRHGHSQNITVTLVKHENKAIVVIEDDGVNTGNIKPGFGIHHMQERIAMLGGSIEIKTVVPHGTKVTAVMPIRRNEADDKNYNS